MHNELLCFVVQNSNVLTFDRLVKLCTDFFREEEIIAARKWLDSLLKNRLPGLFKRVVKMAEGVDATLAPNVGPVERDDHRDTGFFSGGVLSTPVDFQQSRRPSTRECSPTFRYLEGTSDDFAAGAGPPTSLGGSPPIHDGLGTWPGTPGIAPRHQSDMEDGDFRHVSFRRGTKGPTEEDQHDCLLETMAEEIDSLRKILSEVQTGSHAGHAGEGELGRPCRTGTDRNRLVAVLPGLASQASRALPDLDRNHLRPKEVGRLYRRPADMKTTTHCR